VRIRWPNRRAIGQDDRVDDRPGYALIDIGESRRLERFGPWRLDRPALGEGGFPKRDPAAWAEADARFERGDDGPGRWTIVRPAVATPWPVEIDGLTFEIRLASSGGVGCFPEQAPNWRWIADRLAEPPAGGQGRPAEVLHLFAHTGGSTLAAARAGARVVHLDAGRPAIAWARRNAELNGLTDAPIRWIADDALAFARREARRDRRYDGVILDPPSFGHGPGGRPWRLETDLPALVEACAAIVGRGPAFVVLSAHTPGFGPERLGAALDDALRSRGGSIEVDELAIDAASGRRLALGAVARWWR
jgi:23S rRNA (cytosine1962-C5)-methyltransferase